MACVAQSARYLLLVFAVEEMVQSCTRGDHEGDTTVYDADHVGDVEVCKSKVEVDGGEKDCSVGSLARGPR